MSEELERVYTINLGKVLLSQPQHRAVRALNMIREFARRHMKTHNIKIDEDLARQVWSRGARSPPRKIRMRMQKTDIGDILVSRYEGPLDLGSDSDGSETRAVEDTATATAASAAITSSSSDDSGAAKINVPSLPEPDSDYTKKTSESEITKPRAQDGTDLAGDTDALGNEISDDGDAVTKPVDAAASEPTLEDKGDEDDTVDSAAPRDPDQSDDTKDSAGSKASQ